MYVHVHIQSRAISSRGDYSRAASISFHVCSGAATIRERRLFESGVYLRAAFIRERRLFESDVYSVIYGS